MTDHVSVGEERAARKERLAELGAKTRYYQLQREMAELLELFPRLEDQNRNHVERIIDVEQQLTAAPPSPDQKEEEEQPLTPTKGTRVWTTEARKATGRRMKKYWAERRRSEGR